VGIGDMVILGATSGAASRENTMDIATVSDVLRDSGTTAEAVSVRRALPADAEPNLPSAAAKEAAPKPEELPLPTAEPAPTAAPEKTVSIAVPADFQKPGLLERQKAKQEALEAAVAASESAKPHPSKPPVASSGHKESKP
jgi:hypothetical protein